MVDQFPQSLEMRVLELVKDAFKSPSREEWEAGRPDYIPPYDEDRAMLQSWVTLVHRQGLILAGLSVTPSTRAELKTRMPYLIDSAPAWLEAQVQGQTVMTLELFVRGLAQTTIELRAQIERVVAEQVVEHEEVEEILAEAPVPAATDEEGRPALLSGVSLAITAHTKALVDIAHDLDVKLQRLAGFDEQS